MAEILAKLLALALMVILQPLILLLIGFFMGSMLSLVIPAVTTAFMAGIGLSSLTFAQLSGIFAFFSGFLKMGMNNE